MNKTGQKQKNNSFDGINIQYGAGWSCPKGWNNYDSSPSLRLGKMPLVGKLITVNKNRFPQETFYGDIIKGLPIANNSAKAIYASHVLEHLSYEDCKIALKNTFAMLKEGGIFRLVVPDLEERIKLYLQSLSNGEREAGNTFCRSTLFGMVERPKGLIGKMRSAFGNSRHLWMWDENSMRLALENAGFVNIRRCSFNDSKDPDFKDVEDASRFYDDKYNISELALEAMKPALK